MVETKLNREEFIKENLPLVHSICKRFMGRGIEYEDLYQAGSVGLIKATDAFDESKGFAFSTYAVPVIMGEVRRLFRDGGSLKVSRSVKELYLKITRQKEILEQKFGREVTVNELADSLGVSKEEVTEAICAGQVPISLTATTDDGDSQTDVPVEFGEESIFNKILLNSAFDNLEENERQIIKYRYYNGFTQAKTAKILNMSQVQVSRSEKKILLKIRKMLT